MTVMNPTAASCDERLRVGEGCRASPSFWQAFLMSRKNLLTFLCTAAFGLSACTALPRQEKASEGLKDGVMIGYMNCLKPYIKKLDDGLVDPRTIAAAMPNVCPADFDAVATAWSRGEDLGFERLFRSSQHDLQSKTVMGMILKSRVAQKQPN